MPGNPDESGVANRGEKVRAQERAKVDQKEQEEHSLVKSKHRKQYSGLKKIVLGCPRENEARKAFQKVMRGFWKGEVRTNPSAKGSSSDFNPRKVPIHNQDVQLLKTPLRNTAIPGRIPTLPTIP